MTFKKEKQLDDEEVEKKLDSIWANWESRRHCEQKHVPNYIKKQENKKNNE